MNRSMTMFFSFLVPFGGFLAVLLYPLPLSARLLQEGDASRLLPSTTTPVASSAGRSEIRDETIVMAFGDSLTAGEVQPSYPEILALLTGKTVTNDGDYGSTAAVGVGRVSGVIAMRNGAHMLILYGINDVMCQKTPREIASSIDQMLHICLARGVVPVLATYPIPIHGHARFADATIRLNALIRNLARTRGIPLADLEALFIKDGQPDAALYLEDGLHPSCRGNKIIAHAFARLLREAE